MNLLTNGSFEGPHTGPVQSAAAPGWFIPTALPPNNQNTPDLNVTAAGAGGNASTGDDWAWLGIGESIAQTLSSPLTVGNQYELTIDIDPSGPGSDPFLDDTITFYVLDQNLNILWEEEIDADTVYGDTGNYVPVTVPINPTVYDITQIHLSIGEPFGVTTGGLEYAALDNAVLTEVCFAAGTWIETGHGPKQVENLSSGDLVMTIDNGLQPIRWIGSTDAKDLHLSAHQKRRPIRIKAGALGPSNPGQDLVVSPQHRVLVNNSIVQEIFGEREVLVAAKKLLNLKGVSVAKDLSKVSYYHILFDQHELVVSEGAITESLYTGPQAIKQLSAEAQGAIFGLMPEVFRAEYSPKSCRSLVEGPLAKRLAVWLREEDEFAQVLYERCERVG